VRVPLACAPRPVVAVAFTCEVNLGPPGFAAAALLPVSGLAGEFRSGVCMIRIAVIAAAALEVSTVWVDAVALQ